MKNEGPSLVSHALASFAEAYADQNDGDYDALPRVAASGPITVETGL
jgi:hypothetical protein